MALVAEVAEVAEMEVVMVEREMVKVGWVVGWVVKLEAVAVKLGVLVSSTTSGQDR